MRVTFLGTGASGGVPLYGCDCSACQRARIDPRHVRRPCTALVESGSTRVLLDAGLMDIHERFPPGHLTAILLTHFHPDHVQGLFHLRWGVGQEIPVYVPPDDEGCADLYKHSGILAFYPLQVFKPFRVGSLEITPLALNHSKLSFGYALLSASGARFAYLTDTLGLPDSSSMYLRDWGSFAMALDCLYPPKVDAKNHNDVTSALSIIESVNPYRTWLTHIGHDHDAWRQTQIKPLPEQVSYAWDGKSVVIERVD